MIDRTLEIPTPTGPMESFVTHPEEGGPFPVVVVYMDIWGLREELFDVARRIGTVGYYCVVPDLYHRLGRFRFDYRDEQGRSMSLTRLDEAEKNKVLTPLGQLTNTMVMEDTQAIVKFVSQPAEPARPDAMGSMGYCMGGRYALCAAAEFPGRFVASASLHGTSLISDRVDSPHLKVDRMEGEIYCGFAEEDPYAPPSMIAELAELMKKSPAAYKQIVHQGTVHGYALPQRDIYAKAATERDWENIFAMLHRRLPPYA